MRRNTEVPPDWKCIVRRSDFFDARAEAREPNAHSAVRCDVLPSPETLRKLYEQEGLSPPDIEFVRDDGRAAVMRGTPWTMSPISSPGTFTCRIRLFGPQVVFPHPDVIDALRRVGGDVYRYDRTLGPGDPKARHLNGELGQQKTEADDRIVGRPFSVSSLQ